MQIHWILNDPCWFGVRNQVGGWRKGMFKKFAKKYAVRHWVRNNAFSNPMTLSYHKGLVPQKWSSFCNTHSFTNPNWPTLDLCIQAQNWPNHWAAAAKLLQSCPTLCNPIDGSPPGSAVPGFSRQEHWGGLPFPSPMHESEKWNWSHSVVSNSLRPHGLQPTRLLCPWDIPGKSPGVGCLCLLWILHFSGC